MSTTDSTPSVAQIRTYFERDQMARLLGIEILDAAPGTARVRMPIREEHYNSIRIVHGGALFTLADLAFAVASNSHGEVAVAINANIAFLKASSTGSLTAQAEEISRSRRLATYSVRITNDAGDIVAVFQGTVFRKGEPIPLAPA
jgi:acyl-CoA thioesterase